MAVSPLPSRGVRKGRNGSVNRAFSWVPNAKRRKKIRSGCMTSAFSGARRGQKCYVTPAFSGVPNAKHREEIGGGCLTSTFSEA